MAWSDLKWPHAMHLNSADVLHALSDLKQHRNITSQEQKSETNMRGEIQVKRSHKSDVSARKRAEWTRWAAVSQK